jgi:hypothetical protein
MQFTEGQDLVGSMILEGISSTIETNAKLLTIQVGLYLAGQGEDSLLTLMISSVFTARQNPKALQELDLSEARCLKLTVNCVHPAMSTVKSQLLPIKAQTSSLHHYRRTQHPVLQ